MTDKPVKIPKHTFGGARPMTDKEREMIETARCGFGQQISEADKAKIAKAFDENIAAPHKHVWSNWLPAKLGGGRFRKCIDCRETETENEIGESAPTPPPHLEPKR